MKNQQRQFDETQRKNSMIRVKTKGSVKPRIKTNRIPLPKISLLIASCLIFGRVLSELKAWINSLLI